VSQIESSWKFAEELVTESDPIAQARQHSLELGVEPVSPAVGAQLAVAAASSRASSIIEIGSRRSTARSTTSRPPETPTSVPVSRPPACG